MNTLFIAACGVAALCAFLLFMKSREIAALKAKNKKLQAQTVLFEFGKKEALNFHQIASKLQFVISLDKNSKDEMIDLALNRVKQDIKSFKTFDQLIRYFKQYQKDLNEHSFSLYQETIGCCGPEIAALLGAQIDAIKKMEAASDQAKELAIFIATLKEKAFQGVSYFRNTLSTAEKLLRVIELEGSQSAKVVSITEQGSSNVAAGN